MVNSSTGTSGTGDAEDLINGPPLKFRPVDEPEFIKRLRDSSEGSQHISSGSS